MYRWACLNDDPDRVDIANGHRRKDSEGLLAVIAPMDDDCHRLDITQKFGFEILYVCSEAGLYGSKKGTFEDSGLRIGYFGMSIQEWSDNPIEALADPETYCESRTGRVP
jgi:hypothetical protein